MLFKRDIVAEREALAKDFYQKVFDDRVAEGKIIGEDAKKAMADQLEGIDFRMPIKIRKVGNLYQYQKYGLDGRYYEGEYFTPAATAKPTDLGVSGDYNVRNSRMEPTGTVDKVRQTQVNKEGNIGLESTAKPINDNWSRYEVGTDGNVVTGTDGKPVPIEVPTKGTGTQIYIPRNQGSISDVNIGKTHSVYPIYPNE